MSEHFSPKEFACPCCSVSRVSQRLYDALEQLRADVGKPVFVLSGCRCAKRNAEVGGATDSRHLTTETREADAADIRIPGLQSSEVYFAACKVGAFNAGGIGIYLDRGIVHVDTRPARARWGHMAGRYVPFTAAWSALQTQEGWA